MKNEITLTERIKYHDQRKSKSDFSKGYIEATSLKAKERSKAYKDLTEYKDLQKYLKLKAHPRILGYLAFISDLRK